MLETLAEELPPLLPRAKGVNGGSTKQAAAKVATPPSPSAFEMEAELTQVAADSQWPGLCGGRSNPRDRMANHIHDSHESNFEITSKRRKGFPSETRVKRGIQVVPGFFAGNPLSTSFCAQAARDGYRINLRAKGR